MIGYSDAQILEGLGEAVRALARRITVRGGDVRASTSAFYALGLEEVEALIEAVRATEVQRSSVTDETRAVLRPLLEDLEADIERRGEDSVAVPEPPKTLADSFVRADEWLGSAAEEYPELVGVLDAFKARFPLADPEKASVLLDNGLPTFVANERDVLRRGCGCIVAIGMGLQTHESQVWLGPCADAAHIELMVELQKRYAASLDDNPQDRPAIDVMREMMDDVFA